MKAERTMLWLAEFPDMPVVDMPQLGQEWTDESWHNDVSPSFSTKLETGNSIVLWVNYAEPDKREVPGSSRYTVQLRAEDNDIIAELLETDSLKEVFACVERFRRATSGHHWKISGFLPQDNAVMLAPAGYRLVFGGGRDGTLDAADLGNAITMIKAINAEELK